MMADNVSKGQHSMSANNISRGQMIVVTHCWTLHSLKQHVHLIACIFCISCLILNIFSNRHVFCFFTSQSHVKYKWYSRDKLLLIVTRHNEFYSQYQNVRAWARKSHEFLFQLLFIPDIRKQWLDSDSVITDVYLMCLYYICWAKLCNLSLRWHIHNTNWLSHISVSFKTQHSFIRHILQMTYTMCPQKHLLAVWFDWASTITATFSGIL